MQLRLLQDIGQGDSSPAPMTDCGNEASEASAGKSLSLLTGDEQQLLEALCLCTSSLSSVAPCICGLMDHAAFL